MKWLPVLITLMLSLVVKIIIIVIIASSQAPLALHDQCPCLEASWEGACEDEAIRMYIVAT